MTLPEARRVFADLMQQARGGTLTEHARRRLAQARQLLRRSKRPAMNQSIKARHADVFIHNAFRVGDVVYVNRFKVGGMLGKNLFWRVFKDPAVIREIVKQRGQLNRVRVEFPFGKSYWFDEDVLEREPLENPQKLTRSKARLILHEGKVRGRRLTPRQRRYFGARASGYPQLNARSKKVFDVIHSGGQLTRFYKLSEAKRFLKRHPDGVLDAHRIGERRGSVVSPAKRNPANMQRIGRAVEVRYQRTIGRSPGYYKHEIQSRKAGVYTIPPGWVYVSTKSILITEREPRV